jgi:hypothetical protein
VSNIIQVGEFNGFPIFGYAPDKRPLAVGDVLHGFCGGIFGRDHYNCCAVEAVGADWVVTRDLSVEIGTGLDFASGRSTLATLRKYRVRTTKPADGSPCCPEVEL